ncbi:hypothetical protein DL89DRAFT_4176 [Linderina pennispora]|uniref:Uncharacterized protein n=1 Tax=Linderina pennispora TaxID=61395 RepID=A0A1Y1WJP4_9FUNG|nr:uncharacterized protein DL89DRAFT_4176 [Linderina pennispora]ORX73800.1 hypothetical protein DL89DRAFT_4176 [Linderina pennispora]
MRRLLGPCTVGCIPGPLPSREREGRGEEGAREGSIAQIYRQVAPATIRWEGRARCDSSHIVDIRESATSSRPHQPPRLGALCGQQSKYCIWAVVTLFLSSPSLLPQWQALTIRPLRSSALCGTAGRCTCCSLRERHVPTIASISLPHLGMHSTNDPSPSAARRVGVKM